MSNNVTGTVCDVIWCPVPRISLTPWVAMFERCKTEGGEEYTNFALYCEVINPKGVYRLEALDATNTEIACDILRDALNICRITHSESDIINAIGNRFEEGQKNE